MIFFAVSYARCRSPLVSSLTSSRARPTADSGDEVISNLRDQEVDPLHVAIDRGAVVSAQRDGEVDFPHVLAHPAALGVLTRDLGNRRMGRAAPFPSEPAGVSIVTPPSITLRAPAR